MADDFEKRKREVFAPIFFEAGAALYDCQSFEYTIAYLLYLFSRLGARGLDPGQCAAILDDEEKKTAGQLIQMLKKHLDVSEGLEGGLAKALQARNRLIHRFLVDSSERMADVGEHESLLKELRGLRATVQRGRKQLDPLVRALAESIDGATFDAWTSEVKDRFLRDTKEH